jgi:hypothetical protein
MSLELSSRLQYLTNRLTDLARREQFNEHNQALTDIVGRITNLTERNNFPPALVQPQQFPLTYQIVEMYFEGKSILSIAV